MTGTFIRQIMRKRFLPYARLPLASCCMKPTFLILGAQKSGTTSLIRLLAQHPDILPPVTHQEVHYFDMQYHRGYAWYKSNFPLCRRGRIAGEKSPYYLYHPLVPERVAEYNENMRLIVLLRDPVKRAYSHYQMMKRWGFETRPFRAAIDEEMENVESEHLRLARGDIENSLVHQRYSYLARGRYVEQLDRWMKYFPRERFYIETAERFARETQTICLEIFRFLDLPPADITRIKRYNAYHYDPMLEEDQRYLAEYFRPFNTRLADSYGIDISGWTSP